MIWILLIVYQIKHFVADYPLQVNQTILGKYMLGKFGSGNTWIVPLAAHAGVHAVMTFLIALCFQSWIIALLIGLLDAGVHFAVDRIKASPELLGRFKSLTKTEYYEYIAKTKELESVMQINTAHNDSSVDRAIEAHAALNDLKIQWAEKERSNKFFWWSLGGDQMAHHLTHYLLIFLILL